MHEKCWRFDHFIANFFVFITGTKGVQISDLHVVYLHIARTHGQRLVQFVVLLINMSFSRESGRGLFFINQLIGEFVTPFIGIHSDNTRGDTEAFMFQAWLQYVHRRKTTSRI